MRKDIREIIDEARRQGWRVDIAKSGHIKLFPPDRTLSPVVLAGTPSDHRWRENTVALMRQRGFRWPPEHKKE